MRRFRFLVLGLLLATRPGFATNTSTADPNYPATFADIDSGPMRDQNRAFINDIDNLWAAIGPNFLEANQILGAVQSGKAVGLPVPSCFGPNNALTWAPTAGFGCNAITTGGSDPSGPQAAYTVLAGPLGGVPAVPTFRALTSNDLPLPALNAVGGVKSLAVTPHFFLTGISTLGSPTQAQPAFTDISGIIAASQLPVPTPSTMGGVESIAVVPHNYLTGISLFGVPTQAQPAFSDISGSISVSQMASGSGASASTVFRGDGSWGVVPASVPTTQTGPYTAQLSDLNGFINMNCTSACAVTVPPNSSVAYPLGAEITIYQGGNGSASFVAGAGVTITTLTTLTLFNKFATASIKQVATNVWALAGAVQ